MEEEKVKEEREEGTLSIDVYSKDDELVILAPIAGVNPENIDVALEGDILIIKGLRTPPEEVPEIAYQHKENFWGPFSRTIVLPQNLDLNQMRAHYHNGILIIKIPKKLELERKRVEIKFEW